MPALANNSNRKAIEAVSNTLGICPKKIAFIADCQGQQIRHWQPEDNVSDALQFAILDVLSDYGATDTIPEKVILEAVRFVIEKFPQLAVKELKAAYRAWASEEIKIEGAEIYGGKFNVRQLGKVLAAWTEYRNRLNAEYQKKKAEFDFEAEQVEKEARWKAEFETKLFNWLEFAKGNLTDWRSIPEYVFESLRMRGKIQLSKEEYRQLYADAKELAEIEIENRKMDFIEKNRPAESQNLEATAQGIARKLAVFRKLILPAQKILVPV